MGSVRVDLDKKARLYEQQFQLDTLDGVKNFYENINFLRSQRLKGDLDACVLLLDFATIVADAPLTKREQEVLYWRYERELSLKETSKALGISFKAIAEYTRRAMYKIADTFAITEGYQHVEH